MEENWDHYVTQKPRYDPIRCVRGKMVRFSLQNKIKWKSWTWVEYWTLRRLQHPGTESIVWDSMGMAVIGRCNVNPLTSVIVFMFSISHITVWITWIKLNKAVFFKSSISFLELMSHESSEFRSYQISLRKFLNYEIVSAARSKRSSFCTHYLKLVKIYSLRITGYFFFR